MKSSLFALLLGTMVLHVSCQTALTAMSGLHVSGNRIYNYVNQEVRLRGVNRPGTEYSCVQYGKIFDGPTDQASIDKMRDWKMNAVRVPLNEDCWVGKDGVDPTLGGTNYQNAIVNYVNLLTQNSIAVIVDLHWASNGSSATAHAQLAMPSRATAPDVWVSIATAFKSNSAVLFDVYNEPFPDYNAWDTTDAWNCWKNGGQCPGIAFEAAGMDELVAAIRSTGATNIVMISGIQYATSLVRFMEFKPDDDQLAAAVHVYDFNFCTSAGCWDTYWRPVFENIPLIAGETGQTDCSTDFMYDFMHYADANGIGYLAWAWLPANCAKDPSLISDFDGTATDYGISLQTHLNNLAEGKPEPIYATFNIYEDKLTHWVDNWSPVNATLWFNENKTVQSGLHSIGFKAQPENPLWIACWDCFNTTTIRGINFWVHGGGNSNQDITIDFVKLDDLTKIYSGTSTSTYLYSLNLATLIPGGISANSWQLAYLNMSTMPAGAYDGIRFSSTSDQSVIYLDNIRALAINDDGSDHSIVPNTGSTSNDGLYLLPSCLLVSFALLFSMLL